MPLLTEYDGLRFIFNYYFLDVSERDFADSTSLIASTLRLHYARVSKEMGYAVSAPEDLVNYLAYDALIKKQYNKSAALFKLNAENYPKSNSVFDSYADYFVTQNDTVNAIINYQQSLQIKHDSATQRKLNSLTKQTSYHPALKDLQKYAGMYNLETYNVLIVLEIRDGALWAKVPGDADSEFIPEPKDAFTVRGQPGYHISFQMAGDRPLGFTSVQPNGTFKAVFKDK